MRIVFQLNSLVKEAEALKKRVKKAKRKKTLKAAPLPDLTKKQKAEYLKDPHHCPFCKSKDFEAELVDVDYGYSSQKCWCVTCQRAWYDCYKLIDVEAKR